MVERIRKLKFEQQLENTVIAERLGISKWTVGIYLRHLRTGQPPYTPACTPPTS